MRRLLWALALILLVTAARMLPQVVNAAYVDHPQEFLVVDGWSFWTMFSLLIMGTGYAGMDHRGIFYHYLLTPAFALFMAGAWVLAWRHSARRWRILIPALLLIVFFTVWAEGGTPFLRWLYDSFKLLRQWRYTPRMLAAVTPWLVVVVALGFDGALLACYRRARELRYLAHGLWALLLVVTLAAGALALPPTLDNWDRASGVTPNYEIDQEGLYYLRQTHPDEFLPVLTSGFFRYYPFYATHIRAAFGNPDYHAVGLESTDGTRDTVDFPPPYAFEAPSNYRYDPTDRGYRPLPGSLAVYGPVIWENPTVPAYMFTVAENDVARTEGPLPVELTQQVSSYQHHIDWIEADVEVQQPGQLLAVQEIAYPGWRVSVNGDLVALHSLGGLLAVLLPEQGAAHVVFWYAPVWFYIGCLITVLGVLLSIVYLLRLDRWWRARRAAPA